MNHKLKIQKFISKYTNHIRVVSIRKSPKYGYAVKVQDRGGKIHNVNCWVNDKELAYGIGGHIICTVMPIEEI